MRLILFTLMMLIFSMILGGFMGSCGYNGEREIINHGEYREYFKKCHRHFTKKSQYQKEWHCHHDRDSWKHHDSIEGVD